MLRGGPPPMFIWDPEDKVVPQRVDGVGNARRAERPDLVSAYPKFVPVHQSGDLRSRQRRERDLVKARPLALSATPDATSAAPRAGSAGHIRSCSAAKTYIDNLRTRRVGCRAVQQPLKRRRLAVAMRRAMEWRRPADSSGR